MLQKTTIKIMTQFSDTVLAALGLIVLSPLLLILYVLGFVALGSPIYRQKRLGKNKREFTLIKFRTMDVSSPSLPTHMVCAASISPYGKFLRKTKLDELPQLWNVLRGHMSLVGPRPGLVDHDELTEARDKLSVFSVKPGITGLAQVNNIDMSNPLKLAETDRAMIDMMSIRNYFKLIFKTVL